MSIKRPKQRHAKPSHAVPNPVLRAAEEPARTNKWAWIVVAVFLFSIIIPPIILDVVSPVSPDLPFIENSKGPESNRLLADGSTPNRSFDMKLAADGMVTIGSSRHAINVAGEILLAANQTAMDLVVVEVTADVSPAHASQLVRVLAESGAAKSVTLKRVP